MTIPAPAPEAQATKRPKRQAIPKSNLKMRESTNIDWRLIVDKGIRRENLCESDLYALISDQLHPYDRLSVVAADKSFFADLLVLETGRGWCQIMELGYWSLPALLVIGDGLPPGFDIEYKGPDSLYVCTRICDGVVIGSGFPDRQSCLAHLLDHASTRP